jgi:hypothetical protein
MAVRDAISSRAMRRRIVLAGLVVLGAAAAFALRPRGGVDVALVRPDVPAARWSAYRQAVAALKVAGGPEDDRLEQALLQANRAELAASLAPNGDPTTDPAFVKAAAELQAAALHLVEMRGGAHYLDVGRRHGLALIDALGALPHGKPLREALADPSAAACADAGGSFALHAREAGLLGDDGPTKGAEPFLQAVFLDHWIRQVSSRLPVTGFLRGDELEWIQRWRLEGHPGGAVAERLAAAEALRDIPGYPADLNAGVVLFQAGRYAEAARLFARAEGPLAGSYRAQAERAARR